VPQIQDGTKRYRFTVKWGVATATDDAEGEVVATSPVRPGREAVLAALPAFTGEIMQRPPAFSAIKLGGERAYDLARAGEVVEIAPRPAVIEEFILVAHGEDQTEFEVVCQKGTYVRALARDLGEALGTCAYVAKLHRSAVGPFGEEVAISLAALEAAEDRDALLLPVSAGLAELPELRVSAGDAAAIRHGNPVLLGGANAPVRLDACWASHRGEAIAIGAVEAGQFHPHRVLLAG
jgi:tRNA pseudouridine55 synthase